MQRLWLVLNIASGSTTAAIAKEFEAACAHFDIVGRSDFPAEAVPTTARLDAAGADTLVVFGGDGTINAATCGIDDWSGACLVLPGGTMNGLAKALHGDAGWATILDRAPTASAIHVPIAEVAGRRAMVGIILGPASAWFHARERVRSGAFGRLGRALRFAARKTFARTIRVTGDPRHAGRHRAVIVTPEAESLEIASISTASWFAAARLGAQWLVGDWRDSADVNVSHVASVELESRRTISALFDGEPAKLPTPVRVSHALTMLRFIATRPQ